MAEKITEIMDICKTTGTSTCVGSKDFWITIFEGITVLHLTSKKKMKAKRESAKQWIRWYMHRPIMEIIRALSRKLVGHYNYYGVSGNLRGLYKFYGYIKVMLFKALRRRGQKHKISWETFGKIWEIIPRPRICKDIWQWTNVQC